MTQVDITSMDTGNSTRYQTPTFDPRGAFARTLRSGEIALMQRRQRQNRPASNQPDPVQQVNGNARIARPARRYETPTFDPRSMFARTLRSGEIALIERRERLADSKALDVLVRAA